ncbi:sodium:calcium antiporter [Saccharospirillum salsuginis]|uniref:Cation transporter n=1 Tax=Saccharospirillum salsuginis TaxID=418750 RepID=A0A918KJC7_9GAMM|nr:sodium:calcium antiporter [Saccharospirillum salsuginis]GGX63949.1 cation transporter [Saccharospirillum salsuginis]
MFDWPLWLNISVFIAATGVITYAGSKLSYVADRLADRTGLGEALMGAVLLGGSTSLSGVVVSITAAWQGEAQLAVSNAIGGIAAQTAFLAVADIVYRRANLEHAAASLANILFGALLIALMGGVMLAATAPEWSVMGVHPFTPILVIGYLGGLRVARRSRERPMWKPRQTRETRVDQPDETPPGERLPALWGRFAALAFMLGTSGWLVAQSGMGIAQQTGLSGTLVGFLFTAVATSTPELVTTIAAVRNGALTLAIGGILGGNAFDVMFAVAADVAYREGSVYHAITSHELFMTTLGMIMTAVLVMGMLSRQEHGVGRIGFESALILVLYAVGVTVVAVSG